VPVLTRQWSFAALHEPASRDIEVNDLHQAYLRGLRERGGHVLFSTRIERLERNADEWRISAPGWTARAPLLVNAAGAWADEVAVVAGASALGLLPCRRTAITIEAPEGTGINAWPVVIAADETFYFKPDAGRLLVSPADETPCEPCDAQPEEIDVATGAYRFEEATAIPVRRILNRWAGLRTFAPDRRPVIGFDPDELGLFWLAGQGGYGVQTAPAAARLAAALIEGNAVPDDLAGEGIVSRAVAPGRFRACARPPAAAR
jgi:D-arginine dehydrogenase